MPEGWVAATTETKTIGGREVMVNPTTNEAVTQIDGEWYPVDQNGCFYTEFYSPENQTRPPN